jgi:hypothetical protein
MKRYRLLILIILSILFALLFISHSNANSFNIPVVVRENKKVQFQPPIEATTYKWYFDGGEPATSELMNPSILYTNRGEYDVICIADGHKYIQKRYVSVQKEIIKYQKTHWIKCDSTQSYWIKNSDYDFKPGDLIILDGAAKFVVFNDLAGTEQNPIRIVSKKKFIINFTGQNYGLALRNCKHVIVDGKANVDIKYGFEIYADKNGHPKQSGIKIENLSTNIEIFGVEIHNTGFAGIMAKTNPNPKDEKTWSRNFTLTNLKIHHNYIHHTGGEGMYIGYHTYEMKNNIRAHSIQSAKIWANQISHTGWDGMQLGCADSKTEIHNNYIYDYGLENKWGQNAGMSINSGFNGEIYRNRIELGTGNGITIQPFQTVKIYSNIILQIPTESTGIYILNTDLSSNFLSINIKDNIIQAGVGIQLNNKADAEKIKTFEIKDNIIGYSKKYVMIDFNRWYTPNYVTVENNIKKDYTEIK